MIRTFEREHNVEWRNGRVYFDEKEKGREKKLKKRTRK